MKVNSGVYHAPQLSTQIIPGLHMGRILSPAEMAAATEDHPEAVRNKLSSAWALCGDVSPRLFELLRGSTLLSSARERITAFASPAGASYGVFTHQIGAFQHRFLVALFDQKGAEFVRGISNGAFWYSLAGDMGADAVVWRSQSRPGELLPLQSLCGPVSRDTQDAVAEEYLQVVRSLAEPSCVPSACADIAVKYVSLTVVPPARTLLCAAGLLPSDDV